MNQHLPPDLGSRIQAKGMEINSHSQRNRHGHGKRASTKAKLLGILIALSPIIAILWWAGS